MAINPSLFSSKSVEWSTPQDFYHSLNAEFHFTLDPCATRENAKCATYFTLKQDGLSKDWGRHRVYCNPPYGRGMSEWARKCCEASEAGALVALLVNARTDARWFHDWVYHKANDIRFVKGQLRFGNAVHAAPFPSLVAIYRPAITGTA